MKKFMNKEMNKMKFALLVLLYFSLITLMGIPWVNFNLRLLVMILIIFLSCYMVVEYTTIAYYFTVTMYVIGMLSVIIITRLESLEYNSIVAFQFAMIVTLSYLYYYVIKTEEIKTKLYNYSILDELSGLYNKRYYENRVKEEIARAKRNNKKMGIVLLDIDAFKLINDTHGHMFGDHLLKEIAVEINTNAREDETFCRYGGDEFVLILSDYKYDARKVLRKRLMSSINKINDRNDKMKDHPLSVSVGIAIYPDDGQNQNTLFEKADKSMYFSKKSEGTTFSHYSDINE